jgi:uncharacterized surface protein with fasciclin (FAS1) repeats
MKKFYTFTFLIIAALMLAACGGQNVTATEPAVVEEEPAMEEKPMEEEAPELASIAEIAAADGRFTTLVTALDAAGLVETLSGEGSFTVFAPTDDAFAALPEGTIETLLADIETLTNILLYHVVDGKVMAADAVGLVGQEVLTLSGATFTVSSEMDSLYINDAKVIITDIEASNGVIHVIDTVLLPPADEGAELPSIFEIASVEDRFAAWLNW